jgi:CO/xanthine dehydrogenase Mo-binding subunit
MLAGAVVGAAQQLKEKLIRIAAHMMEADASDLELRDGKVGVRGVPGMEKPLAEVALHAHFFRLSLPDDPSLTSGLDAAHVYDHPVTTLPASAAAVNGRVAVRSMRMMSNRRSARRIGIQS